MQRVFGHREPQQPVLTPAPGPVNPEPATETRTLRSKPSNGKASREFSTSPALDAVLNQIAMQACLATGATGAAIAIARKGEMVCRASAGDTAPGLGARLDTKAGLTGLCVSTKQIQRCEDSFTDPRVDSEASRELGVRSLLVLPLISQSVVAGVVELLSSRPRAFSDRDEQTLIALSSRVLQSLERARAPLDSSLLDKSASEAPEKSEVLPVIAAASQEPSAEPGRVAPLASSGRDLSGTLLSLAIVFCAVLLIVMVGIRPAVWRPQSKGVLKPAAATQPAAPSLKDSAAETPPGAAAASVAPSAPAGAGQEIAKQPAAVEHSAITHPAPVQAPPMPPGSLQVFERGREVFRMLPDGTVPPPSAIKQPVVAEKVPVVELSADAVDANLLDRVEPRYPAEAIAQQVEGTVELLLTITPKGRVQIARTVSGNPMLAKAATEAVKQWRFRPQLVDGRAAAMQAHVSLSFRLPR
jgi:TonB family protein